MEAGDGSSYFIIWTVDIALALPREETDSSADPEKAVKKKDTTMVRGHKRERCYHLEYKLLPDDTEAVAIDVLIFGHVAKVYKDNEFQIMYMWQEGDQMWISWTHSYRIGINRDILVSLRPHKVVLKIWNSEEKMCPRARSDKNIRFLHLERAVNTPDDVEDMINKLRITCANTFIPKHKRKIPLDCSETARQMAASFQKPRITPCELKEIRKYGATTVEINLIHFLAGETSVTECFPVCSSDVFEVLINISLDNDLLSDKLKVELNPLVITILSATSLPSSPVPFHELMEKCTPVYCQYQFHNLGIHTTNYHKHEAKIHFRDVNVVLTGLMSPHEFKDFLASSPLQIEVHDRDRRLEVREEPNKYQKTEGSFKQKIDILNPYGIAYLDLSEILFGKKRLRVYLPIKHGPPPPKGPLQVDRKTCAWKMSDTTALRALPQGHYYNANSQLKVQVEIAHPLNTRDSSGSCDGPFGRIIYLFDNKNLDIKTKLRSEILRINGSAFNLDSQSLEGIERALSNFICDEKKDLNYVTGFHVLDMKTHIFVLEGLKQKAVQRLFEAVPINLNANEEESVIVLYNSNLGFYKRIYNSLDVSLSPIYLIESLLTVMKEPRIYNRAKVPEPCFHALSKLSHLCQLRELTEVVKYDLFPSADMIVSMSKRFGVSAELWKLKTSSSTEIDSPTRLARMKRKLPLEIYNKEYAKWKLDCQQVPLKDFNRGHLRLIKSLSEKLQKPKAAVIIIDQDATKPAHNYSIQTFNSNLLAMQLLQDEMAKWPGRRYTYSQQYHSATLAFRDAISKIQPSCRTPSKAWFSYFGSDRTKMNTKYLDEARVEELRLSWKENILHGHLLKQTRVRKQWSWSQRHNNFDLFTKPPPFFDMLSLTKERRFNEKQITKKEHEEGTAKALES